MNTSIEETVLEQLSDPLREEIAINLYKNRLERCEVIHESFNSKEREKLSSAMTEFSYAPKDIIFL